MSLFFNLFERTVGRFLGRLRFPALFSLTVAVFLIDVFVPDVVPFVDEILLALGSLVLGSIKRKPEEEGGEGRSGSRRR